MGYFDRLFEASQRRDQPEDERRAINREVAEIIWQGLTSRDLVPADEITDWVDRIDAGVAAGEPEFLKARVLNPAIYAHQYPGKYHGDPRRAKHQAILYVNEMGMVGAGGAERFADKPSMHGGFEFLKYLAGNLDIVQAIIATRKNQVSAFTRRYREDDNNPLGYRWVRNDGERFTKDDEKEVRRLDSILQCSGVEDDPTLMRWVERRRTLEGFISALITDTLTADACPIETARTVSGKLLGWHNLDFTTVRLAHEEGYDGDDSIVAVQMSPTERTPIIGFERDEIIYQVRNPRSSIYLNDYGVSELEHFVRAATSYVNAFTFNAAALDRNSLPRGFLTVYGEYDQRQIRDFQDKWRDLVRGASKRFNVPALFAKNRQEGGANWTPVDTSTAEMFQTRWIIFLASVLCALYGIAPEEIALESFSSRVSSLSGKDTSEKLQSSRDRGLIPLMLWLEQLLNRDLLRQFTRKYSLTWVGLFPADEDRKHERQKMVCTIDEMRGMDGQEPHPIALVGAAPTNPSLMQIYTMHLQQEAQQQQMGVGGGEDAGQGGLPGSEAPLPYAREAAGGGGEPVTAGGARPSGAGAAPIGAGGKPPTAAPFSGGESPVRLAKSAVPQLVVELRELPMRQCPDVEGAAGGR